MSGRPRKPSHQTLPLVLGVGLSAVALVFAAYLAIITPLPPVLNQVAPPSGGPETSLGPSLAPSLGPITTFAPSVNPISGAFERALGPLLLICLLLLVLIPLLLLVIGLLRRSRNRRRAWVAPPTVTAPVVPPPSAVDALLEDFRRDILERETEDRSRRKRRGGSPETIMPRASRRSFSLRPHLHPRAILGFWLRLRPSGLGRREPPTGWAQPIALTVSTPKAPPRSIPVRRLLRSLIAFILLAALGLLGLTAVRVSGASLPPLNPLETGFAVLAILLLGALVWVLLTAWRARKSGEIETAWAVPEIGLSRPKRPRWPTLSPSGLREWARERRWNRRLSPSELDQALNITPASLGVNDPAAVAWPDGPPPPRRAGLSPAARRRLFKRGLALAAGLAALVAAWFILPLTLAGVVAIFPKLGALNPGESGLLALGLLIFGAALALGLASPLRHRLRRVNSEEAPVSVEPELSGPVSGWAAVHTAAVPEVEAVDELVAAIAAASPARSRSPRRARRRSGPGLRVLLSTLITPWRLRRAGAVLLVLLAVLAAGQILPPLATGWGSLYPNERLFVLLGLVVVGVSGSLIGYALISRRRNRALNARLDEIARTAKAEAALRDWAAPGSAADLVAPVVPLVLDWHDPDLEPPAEEAPLLPERLGWRARLTIVLAAWRVALTTRFARLTAMAPRRSVEPTAAETTADGWGAIHTATVAESEAASELVAAIAAASPAHSRSPRLRHRQPSRLIQFLWPTVGRARRLFGVGSLALVVLIWVSLVLQVLAGTLPQLAFLDPNALIPGLVNLLLIILFLALSGYTFLTFRLRFAQRAAAAPLLSPEDSFELEPPIPEAIGGFDLSPTPALTAAEPAPEVRLEPILEPIPLPAPAPERPPVWVPRLAAARLALRTGLARFRSRLAVPLGHGVAALRAVLLRARRSFAAGVQHVRTFLGLLLTRLRAGATALATSLRAGLLALRQRLSLVWARLVAALQAAWGRFGSRATRTVGVVGLVVVLLFLAVLVLPRLAPVNSILTASPSPLASLAPSPSPALSPSPSPSPSLVPSPSPSLAPSPSPSPSLIPSPRPSLRPSPSPTPADSFAARRAALPACPGQAQCRIYHTQPGDSLSQIGAQFGVTLGDLLALNPEINNPNLIFVAQPIRIPDR